MVRALVLCCACVLATPAAAFAEWHISPMIGVTFAGKTTILDIDQGTGEAHGNLAISGSYLSAGLFGAEVIASVTPKFFQSDTGIFVDKSRLTSLMGNLVVTAPQKWTEYNLRPFVSGGFGLLRVSKEEGTEEGADLFSTTINLWGYNIGGGAIGFFSQSTGVRFDFRYYSTVRGTDHGAVAFGDVNLRYLTASVGVVIRR